MPTYQLRDVDPVAITLCKKGANRQRIFLRKSAEQLPVDQLHQLAPSRILKTDGDWSAFYCVVAAPGHEEDGGLYAEPGTVDVWASPDEIRKAAHRLLKNGAFVNLQHDQPAAMGCSIVESAVALADLQVGGTTIPEGAWYVAVEPTAELRKAIDAGEIESVSLEGSGIRELAKQDGDPAPNATYRTCSKCGSRNARTASKCVNCGAALVAKEDDRTLLQKIGHLLLGHAPEAAVLESGTVRKENPGPEDDVDEQRVKQMIDEATQPIAKAVTDLTAALPEAIAKAVKAAAPAAEPEAPTVETLAEKLGKVADAVDTIDTSMVEIKKGLDALATGASKQDQEPDKLRKNGTDNALAGLLFG